MAYVADNGKISVIYLTLDKKRFEYAFKLCKAGNPGVRMEEVIINFNGELFETTFDELCRAVERLKKSKAVE